MTDGIDLPSYLDPARTPKYVHIFDDFVRADGGATAGLGTGTAVSSGTAAISTSAGAGGWLTLSGAATTDNSGFNLQTNGLGGLSMSNGRVITFKTRLKASNATEIDIMAGLCTSGDTSLIAATTDGFYFRKADDGTTLQAVRELNTTETVTTITTAFDTSVHTLGIVVQVTSVSSTTPTGNVHWYYDGALVLQENGVTLPETTAVFAPSLAMQSGTASGTISCDFDYIGATYLRA